MKPIIPKYDCCQIEKLNGSYLVACVYHENSNGLKPGDQGVYSLDTSNGLEKHIDNLVKQGTVKRWCFGRMHLDDLKNVQSMISRAEQHYYELRAYEIQR